MIKISLCMLELWLEMSGMAFFEIQCATVSHDNSNNNLRINTK